MSLEDKTTHDRRWWLSFNNYSLKIIKLKLFNKQKCICYANIVIKLRFVPKTELQIDVYNFI